MCGCVLLCVCKATSSGHAITCHLVLNCARTRLSGTSSCWCWGGTGHHAVVSPSCGCCTGDALYSPALCPGTGQGTGVLRGLTPAHHRPWHRAVTAPISHSDSQAKGDGSPACVPAALMLRCRSVPLPCAALDRGFMAWPAGDWAGQQMARQAGPVPALNDTACR